MKKWILKQSVSELIKKLKKLGSIQSDLGMRNIEVKLYEIDKLMKKTYDPHVIEHMINRAELQGVDVFRASDVLFDYYYKKASPVYKLLYDLSQQVESNKGENKKNKEKPQGKISEKAYKVMQKKFKKRDTAIEYISKWINQERTNLKRWEKEHVKKVSVKKVSVKKVSVTKKSKSGVAKSIKKKGRGGGKTIQRRSRSRR